MCTISWFYTKEGYHVFFNRDEQVTRPRGLPPAITNVESVNCLMPLDPLGGGTWVAVNEAGITVALLNYYQGRMPKGKLRSRGLIVKALAACQSLKEIKQFLSELKLAKYPPFTLLAFVPSEIDYLAADESVISFCWTGRELEEQSIQSPFFSSALNFDEVFASRLGVYRDALVIKHAQMANHGEVNTSEAAIEEKRIELHCRIHKSHLPEKGSKSICMHRSDAQTVSFSHVAVSANEILFNYTDGPACTPIAVSHTRIARR